jgi:uncharacterized protein with ParB-like and HNH nuclease domain
MSTKTIEQFFSGKSLEIPPYQHDYAWKTANIDDLFEDISEAMEMGRTTPMILPIFSKRSGI